MFPTRRQLAIALSLAIAPSIAAAQVREIQPGARIKFSGTQVGATVTAMVLERRGDTLKVLRANTAPFEVQMSELRTLRVSQGKSRAAGAGAGALWGAGINFLTTGLLLAASTRCGDCNTDVDEAGIALSLISGAATGALVGVLIGKETWADVAIPQRASLHAFGGHRRLGVGLRVAM